MRLPGLRPSTLIALTRLPARAETGSNARLRSHSKQERDKVSRRFETGKTYICPSLCSPQVYKFRVTSRTERSVTVNGKTRKIYLDLSTGIECIDPLGVYEKSPILTAADTQTGEKNAIRKQERNS
jgi:hypothetical protein